MSIEDLFPDNDNSAVEPWNFWSGLDIDRLPKSGAEAKDAGCKFFFSGQPCAKGHTAPRYTRASRCVVCAKESTESRRAGDRVGPNPTASRAHLERAIKALDGLAATYTPSRPCKWGHYLRWVGTNNCVACDERVREERRTKTKEIRILKLYGITLSEREEMAKAQGNSCKICRISFEDAAAMHIDHCHTSGRVRGLLCSKCNQAIGLLQEDPEIIREAARYIEAASSNDNDETKDIAV